MKKAKYYCKYLFTFLIGLVTLFNSSFVSAANNSGEQEVLPEIIYQYVDCLNTENIERIPDYFEENEKESISGFLHNSSNKEENIGFYNYKKASIISYEVGNIDRYMDSELEVICENMDSVECWECILDVEVYRESKYLKEGFNKFIFLVGKLAGKSYIMCSIRDAQYNHNTGEDTDNNGLGLLSYDDPVSAPSLGMWTEPDYIKVNIYSAGENTSDHSQGTPKDVDFKTYCYKVTTQEFGSDTLNQEARKAVALAVKNLGWNRTLVQKYSGYEYDVKATTADQHYIDSITVTTNVRNAVDTIWNYVMLSCDYELFCAFHTMNVNWNPYAREHGGVISHEEANSKGEGGMSWDEILHYFYDYGEYNQEMTQGVIKIVDLTHVQTGVYQTNTFYHWKECTTCGCIHSRDEHSWVYKTTYYQCSVCGKTATSIPSVSMIE